MRKDQSTTHVAFKGTSDVKTDANLNFVDIDEANRQLEDVRNDKTSTNWVLFGHEGKLLKVLGSGNGGYSELEVPDTLISFLPSLHPPTSSLPGILQG